MADEVRHAFARAEEDPCVVVIVLTGAGRGFCAGADMKRLQKLSSGKGSAEDRDDSLRADPGDAAMGESFHKWAGHTCQRLGGKFIKSSKGHRDDGNHGKE